MRRSVVLGFLVLSLMGAQVVSAGQVNVILESNADTAADLTLVNFLSQLNFLNGNAAFSFGSSFNVPAGFSVAGFVFDSGQVNLLLESDADTAADLILVNFLSQLNFLNGNFAFSFGSSFNVPASFSVAGFEIEADATTPPPGAVPEPSPLLLFGAAGMAAAILRWRRRRRASIGK